MTLSQQEVEALEFRHNVSMSKLDRIRNLIPDVSVIPLDKAFAALRSIKRIIDEP